MAKQNLEEIQNILRNSTQIPPGHHVQSIENQEQIKKIQQQNLESPKQVYLDF